MTRKGSKGAKPARADEAGSEGEAAAGAPKKPTKPSKADGADDATVKHKHKKRHRDGETDKTPKKTGATQDPGSAVKTPGSSKKHRYRFADDTVPSTPTAGASSGVAERLVNMEGLLGRIAVALEKLADREKGPVKAKTRVKGAYDLFGDKHKPIISKVAKESKIAYTALLSRAWKQLNKGELGTTISEAELWKLAKEIAREAAMETGAIEVTSEEESDEGEASGSDSSEDEQ